MNELGAATLVGALLTAIYAGVAAVIGARTGDRRWVDSWSATTPRRRRRPATS
jgi:hypothetical protein